MIVKKHFSSVIDDNTEAYFRHLEAIITSIDYNASAEITKTISGVNIRIAPSEYKYLLHLIKEVEKLHNTLGIKMLYSKSMKSSANINFNIIFLKDLVVS